MKPYRMKYHVLMRGDLITLWHGSIRLIAIHIPNQTINIDFFIDQSWTFGRALTYPGPENKSEILTCTTQEEVNQALLVAEVTHKLSL